MREINVATITQNIKEMCIEANHFLTDDMKKVFNQAVDSEKSPLGKQVLCQLKENLQIAGDDMIPICQDTGMAVVFINVGQEVHLTGGDITDAINEGVVNLNIHCHKTSSNLPDTKKLSDYSEKILSLFGDGTYLGGCYFDFYSISRPTRDNDDTYYINLKFTVTYNNLKD